MVYNDYSIEEVLARFEPMIKRQIGLLHIYKNHDEYLQVGLIALWQAYHSFDSEKGAFPAFAQAIVRGRLLSHLRKENALAQRHTPTDDVMLEAIAGCGEENVLERENILSYCEGLTEKQLKWVIQGIVEQKLPREIAAAEGVAAEQVKGWRKEALRKIEKNIRSEGEVNLQGAH